MRNNIATLLIVAALSTAATLTACSTTAVTTDSGGVTLRAQVINAGPSAAEEANRDADLVLISTTDFHATIDRAEPFARAIQALKKRSEGKSLALSAGDLFQGSIEGNESKGRAIIDVFNAAGMDVVAMGNHDIDYGPLRPGAVIPRKGEHPRGAMNEAVQRSQFPWLAANVAYKKKRHPRNSPFGASPTGRLTFRNALGRHTLFPPHLIRTINGLKVGIVGAVTNFTPDITFPAFVADLNFLPLEKTLRAEAEYLRREEHCDVVILVAHVGLECTGEHSSEIPAPLGTCSEKNDMAEMHNVLMALPFRTFDAAIAGHTHLVANEIINGTPVMESGAYAKTVGALFLKFDRVEGQPVALSRVWFQHNAVVGDLQERFPEAPEQQALTATLKPYRDAASSLKLSPVGKVNAPFLRDRMVENPLTDAVAQSLLAQSRQTPTPAVAAIMNAGGVRADITGPTVNYGDVYKALPFENSLAVVRLKGSELRRLIEIAISGQHGVSGFAEIEVTAYDIPTDQNGPWDRDLDGNGKKELWERNVVKSIAINGKALNDHAEYRIATLDFLTQGGDHGTIVYGRLPSQRIRYYYEHKGRDAFAGFVAAHKNGMAPEAFYNPPAKVQVRWIPFSATTNRN